MRRPPYLSQFSYFSLYISYKRACALFLTKGAPSGGEVFNEAGPILNPLKYKEEFPLKYYEKRRSKVASNGATTFDNKNHDKKDLPLPVAEGYKAWNDLCG